MSKQGTRQDIADALAEFWKELLNVGTVQADDRLLEVGGNSLIATMMANRIELTWGFRLTMAALMTMSFRELTELCERELG